MTSEPSGTTGYGAVDDALLDEQLRYYAARSAEYDQWFNREGRYDRGEAFTTAWNEELGLVRAMLDELDLDAKRVLELAPGTGIWTRELLSRGATVTAVEGADEMLAILTECCGGPRLSTVRADLFSWWPTARYDAVVACFFMSHVPDERFGRFASMVAAALEPRGQVFMVDSLREPTSMAVDHELPGDGAQTMRRRLDDGRSFEIVKRFRGDDELAALFSASGLAVRVRRTPRYFQVASRTS